MPEGGAASQRRPTLRDVARIAGVSPATVSFVLNDRRDARVAEQTRARVLAAVEELGFRPDLTARQLRTQRTHTIGLITDEIASSPFAGQIVRGAHDVAWRTGRLLFLVNSTGEFDVEQAAVRTLLDRRVDGLIYAAQSARAVRVPPEMAKVPAVLVNCFALEGSPSLPEVVPAERYGGALAAQHLIDAGHRRIVYLAGDREVWATGERLAAFEERMRAAGLPVAEDAVVYGRYHTDSGYERATAVLARENPPTAILCANDRVALGVLLAAQARGLRVPRDLSIVGYDDQEELADRVYPALTTVSLPHYRMGTLGLRTLLAMIDGGSAPGRQDVTGELIERASVSAPRPEPRPQPRSQPRSG